MTARRMTLPHVLLTIVGVNTTISAVLADLVIPGLAAQHALNPGWPPHAKFHDAQYMVMTVLIGVLGLVLAHRRGQGERGRLLCAAALLSIPWLGMLGALAFPETAAYDPEFADRTLFILGVHGQLAMAAILLLALLVATVVTVRAPRPVTDATAQQGE